MTARWLYEVFSKRTRSDYVRGGANGRIQSSNGVDRGFTLVELLIVVTIIPLIVGAITVGLLSVFSLQSSVASRISGSGDAQVISSTFVKDVQGATQITTLTSSTPQCGPAGASVTQLLGLQLGSNQTVVSYDSVVNGSITSLVRQYCSGGVMLTPSRTLTISNDLNTGNTAVSTCTSTPSSCSMVTSYDWTSAVGVAGLSFKVAELKSGYTFTLFAAPLITSSYVSTGGTPFAPFTLLGTSTDCSTATPVLTVGKGTLSINVAGGTGNGLLGLVSTCPNAVTVANNGTIGASSVITANPALNSIQTNSQATYPTSEYYSIAPLNPFVAPSPTALTPPTAPVTAGSCTASGTTYNCTAGYYAANLTFPNNSTVNFTGSSGSIFSFQNGLTIPNGATVNMATGTTYILNSATTALTTGTSGISITGSQVLVYVGSGSVDFKNNSAISLTAGTGYFGVAIWDASPGGTLTLGNNGTSTNSYGGIYVPTGTVIDNNNGIIATSFIVANSAVFANGLTVTITSP